MVTTLADLITSATRRFSYRIAVNGVVLTPSGQATALNQLTGVPGVVGFRWDEATAQIDLNRAPSWMRAGMPVTIDAGFNGLTMRVWTGSIVAMPGEDPDYLRDKVIVRGATVQVGTPPDDVPVELTATATLAGADVQPPLPAGTHIEHEISVPLVFGSSRLSQIATRELGRYGVVPRRPAGAPDRQTVLCGGQLQRAARAYQLEAIDLSGFTDRDGIELICDLVGITKRSLIQPPEGWYTLDVGAQVRRGRPLDMLAELMTIGGLEAYHTEDGTVVFRQVEFAPGPSHAWEYDVQDTTKARVVSATGELEVTFNPFVRKFSTGRLNIPFLNYKAERVFARSVRHEVDAGGPRTYIDAWGGSRLGGTIAINPIAAFTFRVEREVMGDAVYLVYSCDASSSFDPDGSIATYTWTCNRATTPVGLPATKVMTFRVPASVATPLTLTLQVADNDANTHAVSVDLPTAVDAEEMQIPAIFAALNNNASATPDGGSNWSDQAGSTCSALPDAKPADGLHAGAAVFGFTAGVLKRTTDFCTSALTTVKTNVAGDGDFTVVWWDKNVATRVWAGTSTGRLYRSDNDGAAWTLHKDFAGGYPIKRIATPLGGNSVWVFGGRGDQTNTLIRYQFDVGAAGAGMAWTSIAVGGSLATALAGAGAGVYVAAAASRMAGELAIILNGVEPAVHYTANVFDPTGASWQAATGLTAGLTDGRDIVPDEAQGTFRAFFGNRSVWNTTNSIAYTEAANVLPAGFAPNHVLWLGDYTGHAGTYLIAAQDAGATGGIYKWLASEAAAAALRPATGFATWPATALGKGIAIGAQGSTVGGTARLAMVDFGAGGARNITWQDKATGVWHSLVALPTQIDSPCPHVFALEPLLWFVTDIGRFGRPDQENAVSACARTADGGLTWTSAPIGDEDPTLSSHNYKGGISHVIRTADGTVWGCRHRDQFVPNYVDVFKSPDRGATWGTAKDTRSDSGYGPIGMFAHPTNANIVGYFGWQYVAGVYKARVRYTNDGGTTWIDNINTSPVAPTGDSVFPFFFGCFNNGRLVWGHKPVAAAMKVYTSDDYGATWALRWTDPAVHDQEVFAGINPLTGKAAIFAGDANGGVASYPWWSDDFGQTWTAGTISLESLGGVIDGDQAGLYSKENDTLYVFDANRVYAYAPVDPTGTWSDVTGTLPAGFDMIHKMQALIP